MSKFADIIVELRREYKSAYDILDILLVLQNEKDKDRIISFWENHVKEINRITDDFIKEIKRE